MNSGGQRQRVAIAASIVLQPDLLVADEPVSMLDVSVRAGILKLLDRLREGGLGILMITHDLSTAARFADRIAVMYLGRIVEEGPAQAVVRDPQTRTRRRCYRSSRGATRKSARGARSSAARLPTRSGSRPGAGFTHGVQSPSKTAAESTPL